VTSAGGIITSTTATTYDSDGNVASLTNGTGTTSYLYDSNGYVSQITSANGTIISYSRDAEGRILQQTEKANATAIGLTTKYSYDLYGKLLTVTDSRDRTTTMTYDVVNRLATKTLPNGVKTTYSYDDLNRLTKIVYTKPDGSVLASETYTRNVGGEPSKVLREDGSYTLYEYDTAWRLAQEQFYSTAGVMVRSISYSYDLDGKRTRKVSLVSTQNYEYNADGQLQTVDGSQSYTYDADGRLSQLVRDGKTVILGHDGGDHLTSVNINGTTTQYLYDAQGNRIREIGASGTKNYLVAPNLGNGLESTDLVTDANGNVVSDYVYGGSSIIARLDVNGNPIYYLTDSMGSVIGLVDSDGNMVSRIVYDGFGNIQSGDDGSSQGGDFRFQGQWLETESGLYYMRARDYDAQTGLFLSRDPVDVQEQGVESFNPYQFAFNNPCIYADPTGMFTLSEVNTSQAIQSILQRQLYSAFREKLIDKARGVAGDILASTFKSLLADYVSSSGTLAGSLVKISKGISSGGEEWEAILTKSICSIILGSYTRYFDKLWLQSQIDYSGNPEVDGINCGDPRIDENGKISTKGLYVGFGQKPRPDFIIKEGGPASTDPARHQGRGYKKSYLIGDVKARAQTVLQGLKTKQGQAIMNYAKYNSGHEYSPIILFATAFGQGKVIEEKIVQEALKKNVFAYTLTLFR
jgi:RHS repeat-associated protein